MRLGKLGPVLIAVATLIELVLPLAAAAGPEVEEGVLLIGPNAVNVVVEERDTGVVVATSRVYGGLSIQPGQSVKVDLVFEEVGTGAVGINKFRYEVFVDDQLIVSQMLGGTSFGGLHYTYTTPGTYKIVITGMQGVTKYNIVIDELP